MITEHQGKFHIRLSAHDRVDVLDAMKTAGIAAAFFAVVRDDLLIALTSMEDALFLAMAFG